MELIDRKSLLSALFNQMQKLANKEITAHEAAAFSKQAEKFQKLQERYESQKNILSDEEKRSIEEELKILSAFLER